jgi:hypothetical protein
MVRRSGARRRSKKGKTPSTRARPATQQITSEEALKFIQKMQERFRKPPRTEREKAALQEYLAQFTDAELKAVGSRVESDLMLRPARTIQPGDFEKPRRRVSGSRRKPK